MAEEKDQSEQKELNKDSLESLLKENQRKQVRSDYRRSLGSEAGRRYKEWINKKSIKV